MACSSDYELTGERPDVNPGDVTECPFTGNRWDWFSVLRL